MLATRKTIKDIIGGATRLFWKQNNVAKVMTAGLATRHQVSTARWINSVLRMQQNILGRCHNLSCP